MPKIQIYDNHTEKWLIADEIDNLLFGLLHKGTLELEVSE